MVASLMSSTNLQSMSSMAGMMENLQGLVPSTTSSGSGGQTTEAAADLSSLFSDFVSKSDSVTGLFSGLSNIENQIGSLLDSFNTSTLLSTLGKAAKVAVVTKVVKESDLWEQLEAAINSTDEYFTSLPQTQKLLECTSLLLLVVVVVVMVDGEGRRLEGHGSVRTQWRGVGRPPARPPARPLLPPPHTLVSTDLSLLQWARGC